MNLGDALLEALQEETVVWILFVGVVLALAPWVVGLLGLEGVAGRSAVEQAAYDAGYVSAGVSTFLTGLLLAVLRARRLVVGPVERREVGEDADLDEVGYWMREASE